MPIQPVIAGLLLVTLVGAVNADEAERHTITCAGSYPKHLQGVAVDDDSIYWSFTTRLVKTNRNGEISSQIEVANHHGDLCIHDGKVYVAVNLGRFNDPAGNADSWVYVYDALTLDEVARHQCQQVFHGAGGIGACDGHFFVVGGLPNDVPQNYVYEYDGDFRFVKQHEIASGNTLMGIQTATFAHNRWWFGCYGKPGELLVTDRQFEMFGRYDFNCALGIEAASDGRLWAAKGSCASETGCVGSIEYVRPDEDTGLRAVPSNTE